METVSSLSFLSLLPLLMNKDSCKEWFFGLSVYFRIKSPGKETVHKTTIELATKVTDTEEKLKHTLSHELCHIAAWILSKESNPPHGNAFKLWSVSLPQTLLSLETLYTPLLFERDRALMSASIGERFFRAKRIMLVRKDIEVTTTHDYQIVYKYRWQCDSSSCGKM